MCLTVRHISTPSLRARPEAGNENCLSSTALRTTHKTVSCLRGRVQIIQYFLHYIEVKNYRFDDSRRILDICADALQIGVIPCGYSPRRQPEGLGYSLLQYAGDIPMIFDTCVITEVVLLRSFEYLMGNKHMEIKITSRPIRVSLLAFTNEQRLIHFKIFSQI